MRGSFYGRKEIATKTCLLDDACSTRGECLRKAIWSWTQNERKKNSPRIARWDCLDGLPRGEKGVSRVEAGNLSQKQHTYGYSKRFEDPAGRKKTFFNRLSNSREREGGERSVKETPCRKAA